MPETARRRSGTIVTMIRYFVALLAVLACSALANMFDARLVSVSDSESNTFLDTNDREQQNISPAGEVFESHVSREGDHFRVRIDMLIDANLEQVRNLLTDYAHLDRISSSITGSELLYSNKPHYRVRVMTESCVVFYCRKLVQVQDVTELTNGLILVMVVPELSDFSYGQNLWRIQAQDGGTRITYSSDVVPRFWVPPIVGTTLFQHKLLEESRHVIENLERLANPSRFGTKK